ncbi:MAG: rhodanese-like domain-containing protein [Chloroflexota bacterium]
MHKKLSIAIVLTLVVSLLLGSVAIAQEPSGDFGVIQRAADAYLTSATPVITADALYALLNDGDASNDPFIVSVRSAEHYALGHIPGAVNIPWKQIAKAESLAQLPTDKQIVTYCYTGHTGQVAATVLGTLGYNVVNLKFGMMGWTKNDEVLAITRFGPTTDQRDYPLETEANEATETYDFPVIDTGKDEVEDIIAAAADAWLAEAAPTIAADALFELLNDGDTSNDPFILSVRSAEHYALGHIPGAVNISLKELAKPENLAKLPTDKQIVTYCYTGHTGQMATTVLSLLGYDAINLKYGMMGWTEDDTVLATGRFDPATQPDYAFEGSLAPAAEEETTTEETTTEEATPEVLPVTGMDPVSVAPIGLVIFGALSMGIGAVGYAINRRKAA